MTDTISLVTGANSGMGKAAVCRLADAGMHVVMLCRDEARGQQALDEVLAGNSARSAELMLCDLSSFDSIRSFAASYAAKFTTLDVLINNAGVITLDRQETQDGLELQFGVNHMGHFLLTLLLLDQLNAANAGRIVVYSSGAHKAGKVHFDDINLTHGYNVIKSYGQSKLCNVLFARELGRRLLESGSRVTVNACHPGAVATEMGVDRTTGFGKNVVALLKPLFLTPNEGCDTAVFLALDPSVRGVSGGYFHKRKLAISSRRSHSVRSARRLFTLSEKLCGTCFEPY